MELLIFLTVMFITPFLGLLTLGLYILDKQLKRRVLFISVKINPGLASLNLNELKIDESVPSMLQRGGEKHTPRPETQPDKVISEVTERKNALESKVYSRYESGRITKQILTHHHNGEFFITPASE